MAWVEIHQSLPTHRKTLKLADALGIEPVVAVGHLVCLWLWALDNARPDGFLMGASPRTIARAAEWRKDPVKFVDALGDAGFLDGAATLHDWPDYSGRLNDQRDMRRISNRDAQARRRQRLRGADVSADCQQPVITRQHDSADAVSTGQQSTVPNLTVPNLTGDVSVSVPGSNSITSRQKQQPEHSRTRVREDPDPDLITEHRRRIEQERQTGAAAPANGKISQGDVT